MANIKYTRELLLPIVMKSESLSDVARALGLEPRGGTLTHLGKRIDALDINRNHFIGQGHMKGKKAINRRPTKDYLQNKYAIKSYKLKQRLLDEGYFEHKCQVCGRTKWMDKPIPLELHHINCNHFDNTLDNLQLLCPNCHAVVH